MTGDTQHAAIVPDSVSGTILIGNLAQAWLVLALALIFGATLAGVQIFLGPIIEANKLNETLQKVPELVLGQALADKMAAENQHLDITRMALSDGAGSAGRRFYTVYEARYQGDVRGWVIKTVGQGYADKIELLLGLSADAGRITGLFILDQKETPGLGNKIADAQWRAQFIGKSVEPSLTVVKNGAGAGHEIDAVSGATISSRSVTRMVDTAVVDLRQQLVSRLHATDGGKG